MQRLKIVHVVQGKVNIDRPNGVNAVIHGLSGVLVDRVDLIVLGISKGVIPGEVVNRGRYNVVLFPNTYHALDYFRGLHSVDYVHLHSVWQWTNYSFAKLLITQKIKYALTLHSGLSPDRVRRSKYLIRLLYHRFFQKFILDNASFIQALTHEESSDIISWTSNRNIVIIPNGVAKLSELRKYDDLNSNIHTLGYLGRFGKEKNVKELIESVALLPTNVRSRLIIELVGPFSEEYSELDSLVKSKKLEDNIRFMGPLFGGEKYTVMSRWNGYIHVALSDVVSIALMEALSLGIPSIVSRTSHVSYFYGSEAFIMVEPNRFSIANGIIAFLDEEPNWKKMSQNAQTLANTTFNWEHIADRLVKEYTRNA